MNLIWHAEDEVIYSNTAPLNRLEAALVMCAYPRAKRSALLECEQKLAPTMWNRAATQTRRTLGGKATE